jgi:hypothetical protein
MTWRLGSIRKQAISLARAIVVAKQLIIFIYDTRIVNTPSDTVTNRPGSLGMKRQPPKVWGLPKNLLPVSPATDVKLALSALFTLKILNGGVVVQD